MFGWYAGWEGGSFTLALGVGAQGGSADVSHFSVIGLRVEGQDAMMRLVDAAASKAVDDVPAFPGQHLRWTDPSGAALAMHLDGPAIACVTPFFIAPEATRWRVRTSSAHDDSKCVHCGGADCDLLDVSGEMVTRATIQWLHFQPFRGWLAEPREFSLRVVAFAHRAAFYDDSAAFEAGQESWWPGLRDRKGPTGQPMGFAEESFLPEGMFGDGRDVGDAATVLFAGRVEHARTVTNALTGLPFGHARIRTLPGSIDIVFDQAEGMPVAGKLAVVRAWLVGEPDPAPPPDARTAPRGFLRKLFGA